MEIGSLPALGPFRIVGHLGRGSMATVLLAEPIEPDVIPAGTSRVALKVMHPELALSSRSAAERFVREARLGLSIEHPALVRTLAFGDAVVAGTTLHWIAQEVVEGGTLRESITRLSRLPEALVVGLAIQIAEGLAALHEAGAFHRDLKPENLLVSSDEQVKLLDLGAADLQDEGGLLTTFGRFIGSPLYASPEQFRGEELTPACDLYALGVVLYEALTGSPPFEARGFHDAMRRHLDEVAPLAGRLEPTLSPFIQEVVATLLEKVPANRFASASDLARVLRERERGSWWRQRSSTMRTGARDRVLERLSPQLERPIVGRSVEMARISRHLDAVAAGGSATLLLAGEEGIGKSRLAAEVLSAAACRSFVVLHGAADPDEPSRGPLARSIAEHLGVARIGSALREHLRPGTRADALEQFLLDGPDAGAPASERTAVANLVAELARGLCQASPVAWVLDDMDEVSSLERRAVVALARAEVPRLLLVVVARQGGRESVGDDLRALPRVDAADLSRLADGDMDELLLAAGGLEDAFLRAHVREVAAGSPLLAWLLVEDLRSRSSRVVPGSSFATRLPRTVREVFRDRIEALDAGDREILEAASVQGMVFDADALASQLDRKPLDVLQCLARIERGTGLVRSAGAAIRFDHPVVHALLLESMPGALRARQHEVLGRRRWLARGGSGELPPDDVVFVAQHLVAAGRAEDVEHLLAPAVARLVVRDAHEEAIRLSAQALESLPASRAATRIEVRLTEARAWSHLSRRTEEGTALDAAMAEAIAAGDEWRVAKVRLTRAAMLVETSRLQETELVLDEVDAMATLDPLDRLKTRFIRAGAWLRQGRLEDARRLLEEVVELCRLRNPRDLAPALHALGVACARLSRYDEALAAFREHAETCRLQGAPVGEASARADEATVLMHLGQYESAVERFRDVLRLQAMLADRWGEAISTGNLGVTLANLGRLGEARAAHERALRLSREIGDEDGACRALDNLVSLDLEEGGLEDACARLDECEDIASRLGLERALAYARLRRAQVARMEGEHEESIRLATSALEMRRQHQEPEAIAESALELVRCLLAAGHHAEARPILAESRQAIADLPHAELRTVTDAHAVLLGEGGLRPETVTLRGPLLLQAEACVALHAASAAASHAAEAQRLLSVAAESLAPSRRERFWAANPLARALRAARG